MFNIISRFWQYGRWVEVVIDDLLPTHNGKLVYMRSSEGNEFWSALLEKAYAKLHGSYEALDGGSTAEALVDFTGGVTEMYDLKAPPANLFVILTKAFERSSMMGCSMKATPGVREAQTPQGLVRGHAYSVTKAALINITTPNRSGSIALMRLRNPWGGSEWNGPFSDTAREWSLIPESAKKEIGLNFDNDGEFWMSFRDFMNNFDLIEICNLSPDDTMSYENNKKKWNVKFFADQWVVGVSAGGCANYQDSFYRNPQYVMAVEDVDKGEDDGLATVVVGLMQRNSRLKRTMGYAHVFLHIGFSIFSVTKQDFLTRPQKKDFFQTRRPVAMTPVYSDYREVSYRFKLPPGCYLIVPSTFNPNEEGEFIIRIFSEGRNTFEENDKPVNVTADDDNASWENVEY